MIRFALILFALFLLTSCSSLRRSDVVNKDKSEVFSLISLKIIYDGKQEDESQGSSKLCKVGFRDGDFNEIETYHEKDTNFYLIKHEPGKITLTTLKCLENVIPIFYVKSRKVNLYDWGFWSHPNYLNYIGNVTIKYRPKGFRPIDLFALGGVWFDSTGLLEVKVEDKIDDVVKFIKHSYPELKTIPIARNLLTDPGRIQPEKKVEPYLLKSSQKKVKNRSLTTPPIDKQSPFNYRPSIYYRPPPYSAKVPYSNPYATRSATTFEGN